MPSADRTGGIAAGFNQRKWHPLPLAAGLAAALILFGSWGAGWWDAADEAVFQFFDSHLRQGRLTTFWAIANWRPFDLVSAAVVAFFALAWLRAGDEPPVEARIAAFLAFCVLLLAAKGIEHLVTGLLEFRRLSPTLTHADAVRLSEIVTWITVKDRGSTVFPGDHAFVLFSTVGFLWIQAGRVAGMAAALALLPFAVPRIAAGAHWLTDVAVGGLSMALLLLGVGYATPLAAALSAAIGKFGGRAIAGWAQLGRRLRLLPARGGASRRDYS